MTRSAAGLLFTALFAIDGWHYNLDEARQLATIESATSRVVTQ